MERVTVFGLGEAGSLISSDLAAAGHDVHAYDPADVDTPHGVTRHALAGDSVEGSTVILSIVPAVDAQAAIAQAWNEMKRGAIYADCSTSPPHLKEDIADTAALRGLRFADVALLSPVPGNGFSTPSLASGPGAAAYAEFANTSGGSVEAIGDEPGTAATRKLLRSVVMKGLAALVIEALEGARAAGEEEWVWEHLHALFDQTDGAIVERLVAGTAIHHERRRVEMESARELLEGLEARGVMTEGTVEVLRRVGIEGLDPPPGHSVS